MKKSEICIIAAKHATSHFKAVIERCLIILVSTIYAGATAFLVALVTIPAAYQERGYWAIGGEWFIIFGSFIIAFILSKKMLKGEIL